MDGSLSSAIDRLTNRIRQLLGKRFTDADDVTIMGNDFPCFMFNQLYADNWFGTEIINACLTLSDKLPFVRFSFCIDLAKPKGSPFQVWAKRIMEWRSKANGQRLVYFTPLIHNNIHFSLLEINEVEGKIFHYDSLTSQNDTISTSELSNLHEAILVRI